MCQVRSRSSRTSAVPSPTSGSLDSSSAAASSAVRDRRSWSGRGRSSSSTAHRSIPRSSRRRSLRSENRSRRICSSGSIVRRSRRARSARSPPRRPRTEPEPWLARPSASSCEPPCSSEASTSATTPGSPPFARSRGSRARRPLTSSRSSTTGTRGAGEASSAHRTSSSATKVLLPDARHHTRRRGAPRPDRQDRTGLVPVASVRTLTPVLPVTG